jgi:uncharacterized repeat protein (TIGR03803 family)
MNLFPQVSHFVLAASILSAGAFSVRAQVFENLYDFTGGTDGGGPQGALIQATDGSLYGTASYGGKWGVGSVFKITPEGALTPVASFDGTNGSTPYGALLQASDGNFYGTTTYGGGSYDHGTVFRMTPAGSLTAIGTFVTGGGALGDLVEGPEGFFYGVRTGGGFDPGAIFRISTNGWPAWFGDQAGNIHMFGGPEGAYPSGGLLLARDGNFYGVTAGDPGTMYKLTRDGSIALVSRFSGGPGNATWPIGKLVQADDGSFYGAAGGGFHGTVFKVTPEGTLTTFDRFNGYNGSDPIGSLVQANDGYLYGEAYDGGDYPNHGTVFSVALGCGCTDHTWTDCGNLSLLFELGVQNSGLYPYAGLVQGGDGNLYGTTAFGGAYGSGNIFRIVMPGPLLTMSHAGESLALSWRTNFTGYSVEFSTDLSRDTWVTCTNAAAVVGGRYVVTNSVTEGSRFFRLSRIHAVEKPRMDTNGHEFTNSNDNSAVCAAVTK